MERLDNYSVVCDILCLHAAAMSRSAAQLARVALELKTKAHDISGRTPQMIDMTIHFDEDEILLRNTSAMIPQAKKLRTTIDDVVGKLRGIYRDIEKFERVGERKRKRDTEINVHTSEDEDEESSVELRSSAIVATGDVNPNITNSAST